MSNIVENLDATSLTGTSITLTAFTLSNIFTESNLKALMYAVTIVAGLTTICLNIKNLLNKKK